MVPPRNTNRSPPPKLAGFICLPVLGDNERVDWFYVISAIERRGYSLQDISDMISRPAGTLKGWKYGARPRFEDALPLIALWSTIAQQDASQLPLTKKVNHEDV